LEGSGGALLEHDPETLLQSGVMLRRANASRDAVSETVAHNDAKRAALQENAMREMPEMVGDDASGTLPHISAQIIKTDNAGRATMAFRGPRPYPRHPSPTACGRRRTRPAVRRR